jgi:GDP-D-mannose 3', 5'-epimerase
MKRALVTGAGGFIGHHLVLHLKQAGYWVRGVDLKQPHFRPTAADEFITGDLRNRHVAQMTCADVDEVYDLAANMGGMEWIANHHAEILHDNTLISTHVLEASREAGVARYFFASSACVYPEYLQDKADVFPLAEDDAYPAEPQDAYGWQKLVHERLVQHYADDYGMDVRIARFHNIYGPYGAYQGGREKAPAALCRKIAQAKAQTGSLREVEIEIIGDGEQTRSFCYIDDCVQGIRRLMQSNYNQPLNIGSRRLVTINQLADIIGEIAGVTVRKKHVPGAQGVRGRNSDNTRILEVLRWQPATPLEVGLTRTYHWINAQVHGTLVTHMEASEIRES